MYFFWLVIVTSTSTVIIWQQLQGLQRIHWFGVDLSPKAELSLFMARLDMLFLLCLLNFFINL